MISTKKNNGLDEASSSYNRIDQMMICFLFLILFSLSALYQPCENGLGNIHLFSVKTNHI